MQYYYCSFYLGRPWINEKILKAIATSTPYAKQSLQPTPLMLVIICTKHYDKESWQYHENFRVRLVPIIYMRIIQISLSKRNRRKGDLLSRCKAGAKILQLQSTWLCYAWKFDNILTYHYCYSQLSIDGVIIEWLLVNRCPVMKRKLSSPKQSATNWHLTLLTYKNVSAV